MSALDDERIWPYWFEVARGSTSAPDAPRSLPTNGAARNWTAVGSVGSRSRAAVDPRGLVTPVPGGWSVDWWIGDEEGWHFPSRSADVTQQLVGDGPVVETAMQVVGGAAVERVYGARTASDDVVVIEVHNRTKVPFACAFALRPYNLESSSDVGVISLDDQTVTVDGRAAVWLPRPPAANAVGRFDDGDVAWLVASEATGNDRAAEVRCERGRAQAAFVYPLAHDAVIRIAMPIGSPRGTGRVVVLPSSEQVSAGWAAHAARGLSINIPEPALARAVEASRRFLLLAEGERQERHWIVEALDRWGLHDEAAQTLASPGPRDAARWVWAMATHLRLTGTSVAPEDGSVREVIRDLKRGERASNPGTPWTAESVWSLRATTDGAELLSRIGRRADARRFAHRAEALRGEMNAWLARLAGASADEPFHTDRAIDVLLAHRLGLVAPVDEAVGWAIDHLRAGCLDQGGVTGRGGFSPHDTLMAAHAEAARREPSAVDRLDWLLGAATSTWTWPTAIDPVGRSGCSGSGHDLGVSAGLLCLVRDLLLSEGDGGLVLCPVLPPGWLGRSLDVHGAPTSFGKVSFALRWHGDRPALLWEIETTPDRGRPTITIPSLDRQWSSNDLAGETLLHPPKGE